jgi:hypothetical protein
MGAVPCIENRLSEIKQEPLGEDTHPFIDLASGAIGIFEFAHQREIQI